MEPNRPAEDRMDEAIDMFKDVVRDIPDEKGQAELEDDVLPDGYTVASLPRLSPIFLDGCSDCDGQLVLHDHAKEGKHISVEHTWFDEFVCPNCDDPNERVRIDAPDGYLEKLIGDLSNPDGKTMSIEEAKEEFLDD